MDITHAQLFMMYLLQVEQPKRKVCPILGYPMLETLIALAP